VCRKFCEAKGQAVRCLLRGSWTCILMSLYKVGRMAGWVVAAW